MLGGGDSGEIRQEGHGQIQPRATTAAVVGAESADGWSNGVDQSALNLCIELNRWFADP